MAAGARGSSPRPVSSLLAAALAPRALAGNGGFTPVTPESPNAERIHDTWLFVSIFIVAIFVLVEVLLVTFIWRYRRQRRERFEDGAQIHGATNLELMWTVGAGRHPLPDRRVRLLRAARDHRRPRGERER